MPGECFLVGERYLIHDWDPLFTAESVPPLAASRVQSVKLPPRSPNLNAHAERFVRTVKESCLEHLILFGEGSIRKALHEFVENYHRERNHQGLGKQLIIEGESVIANREPIQGRQLLGGMLKY
jgi:transposase InsO family protein